MLCWQVLVSVCSSLAYLCVGLVRAWASTAVPSMTEELEEEEEEEMSENMISWVVAAPPIGAITGSLLSFFFLKRLGRKMTILTSGLLFLTAFLCLGLARQASSPAMVLVFRAVSGTGVGLAVPSVSIFIAETVAAQHRGRLACLPALLHATGVLLCYVTGAFLPWDVLSYVCCVPALLLILTILPLPDSPAHLANTNKTEAAVRSYDWYRSSGLEVARSALSCDN